MNLNKVFILGNVTRDPEVRAMPSGTQVTSFGMATNRFYTDSAGQKKQEAEFHNIVCFGKLADISSKYLTKGGLVLIEGRIKTSSWQGSDGVKKFKTEIIAESLQLGPRLAGSTPTQPQNKSYSTPENHQSASDQIPIIEENYTPAATNNTDQVNAPLTENSEEIDVKDIPF
jgi:single-strand DNA-binding protein